MLQPGLGQSGFHHAVRLPEASGDDRLHWRSSGLGANRKRHVAEGAGTVMMDQSSKVHESTQNLPAPRIPGGLSSWRLRTGDDPDKVGQCQWGEAFHRIIDKT
jgi:hypothetical protein